MSEQNTNQEAKDQVEITDLEENDLEDVAGGAPSLDDDWNINCNC